MHFVRNKCFTDLHVNSSDFIEHLLFILLVIP